MTLSFGLLLPFALGGQRRRILRGGRIIFYAVDANVGQFVVCWPTFSGYIPRGEFAP